MSRGFHRSDRVAEEIHHELAELLRLEVKDPRVRLATVTGVEVSTDLTHAKVFYTGLGSDKELSDLAAGLHSAAGFLRAQLGRRLKLRVTPDLHFVHDASVARGMRLSRLIDEAVEADRALGDDHSA